MPDVDYSQSALGFVPLLQVRWAGGGAANYARSREPLTIDGTAYTAMPEMELKFPMLDGGIDDRPVKLVVPDDTSPFDHMMISTFPECEITVLEGDFEDGTAVPAVQFVGIVQRTKAHYKGKSRLMEVQLVGRKFFLKDVSLGIKATDRCPWFFGDHVCGANVNTNTATISTINGTVVNFSSLPQDSAKGGWSAGRYTRGYIEKDGLRILVRQHKVGQAKFVLAKAPPQIAGWTWEGATVTVGEGCDKAIDACEAHGQQSFFGGVGRKMPKYNPIIENKP